MEPRKFTRIGTVASFFDTDTLSDDMTIRELVTLVAGETTLTSRMVEGRILGNVNSMLARFTPGYEDLGPVEGDDE